MSATSGRSERLPAQLDKSRVCALRSQSAKPKAYTREGVYDGDERRPAFRAVSAQEQSLSKSLMVPEFERRPALKPPTVVATIVNKPATYRLGSSSPPLTLRGGGHTSKWISLDSETTRGLPAPQLSILTLNNRIVYECVSGDQLRQRLAAIKDLGGGQKRMLYRTSIPNLGAVLTLKRINKHSQHVRDLSDKRIWFGSTWLLLPIFKTGFQHSRYVGCSITELPELEAYRV